MGSSDTSVIERINPLVSNTIRMPGYPSYTVACFEGKNWSLAPLQKAGDQRDAPNLAYRVGLALRGLGARYAYAPSPVKFNGRIVQPDVLTEEIPLGESVVMYRNAAAPADGTFLASAGSAITFSAGGCSFITASLPHELVVAHAGRDCVIDRTRIMTRGTLSGRHRESVVNSIVDALAPAQSIRRQLQVGVYYSIRPEDFRHDVVGDHNPDHLKYNEAAGVMLPAEYGDAAGILYDTGIGIDVPRIIRAQFIELGVPETNINLDHAYLSDELPTTRNGGGRYLAAAVRHS